MKIELAFWQMVFQNLAWCEMTKSVCVSKSPAVDKGTKCMQRSHVPGNVGVSLKAEKERKAHEQQEQRLKENEEYLKNTNIRAFLETVADADGGDYDLKYGGIKGKKNDKYKFTKYSTHPGPGFKGKTAAGMYQITIDTWMDWGGRMGLRDFSPHTQDLIAIEGFRRLHIIDKIVNRDIEGAVSGASKRWAAVPQGKGLPGRFDQPYKPYDDFVEMYKSKGGLLSEDKKK